MPMPSLFKYFAFVGTALLAIITLANFLLDPATGAKPVQVAAKTIPQVQHDPRASKIERWRNEQAALKAAEQQQTAENASVAVKSARPDQTGWVEPVQAPPAKTAEPAPQATQAPPAPQPVQTAVAEPAMQTAEVAAPHDADAEARAAEAARLKVEKAKAEKARKARLARERAKMQQQMATQDQGIQGSQGTTFFGGARERTASNQQDQYYYGQRGSAAQPPRGPGYAFAPRQDFGPFGIGRGW